MLSEPATRQVVSEPGTRGVVSEDLLIAKKRRAGKIKGRAERRGTEKAGAERAYNAARGPFCTAFSWCTHRSPSFCTYRFIFCTHRCPSVHTHRPTIRRASPVEQAARSLCVHTTVHLTYTPFALSTQAYDQARDRLEAQYEVGVVVTDEATKPPPSCVEVRGGASWHASLKQHDWDTEVSWRDWVGGWGTARSAAGR